MTGRKAFVYLPGESGSMRRGVHTSLNKIHRWMLGHAETGGEKQIVPDGYYLMKAIKETDGTVSERPISDAAWERAAELKKEGAPLNPQTASSEAWLNGMKKVWYDDHFSCLGRASFPLADIDARDEGILVVGVNPNEEESDCRRDSWRDQRDEWLFELGCHASQIMRENYSLWEGGDDIVTAIWEADKPLPEIMASVWRFMEKKAEEAGKLFRPEGSMSPSQIWEMEQAEKEAARKAKEDAELAEFARRSAELAAEEEARRQAEEEAWRKAAEEEAAREAKEEAARKAAEEARQLENVEKEEGACCFRMGTLKSKPKSSKKKGKRR